MKLNSTEQTIEETSGTIPTFTKEQYLKSAEPYEYITNISDKFLRAQAIQIQKEAAKAVGVGNFVSLLKAYQTVQSGQGSYCDEYTTEFDGQEMELKSGQWVCDEFGVSMMDTRFGAEICACNHPIMPVQRLINIDEGVEKLKIAFRKGKFWRSIIVDKETLASANKIVALARHGIAVNSENARYLVRYITDMELINYDEISEVSSVSRFGWIEDYGFSPYVENLVYDGDGSFKSFYDSVTQRGSFDTWKALCKKSRKHNTVSRIILAASFASVLVEPCGCLPFFVHLWGGTETGKTVALMFAASVWANPSLGEYIHTFNSTSVGMELSAGFVNSLPLCIDELQIQKDRKDFDTLIYQLSEGVGRTRGQKTGGLQRVQTWRNTMLTTGEYPITNPTSGGGTVNRTIEIDCKGLKLFENPKDVVDIIKKNYGKAGKLFVAWLTDNEFSNLQDVKQLQKDTYSRFEGLNTTEKQAMACSLILTADSVISDLFFDGEDKLIIDDILPFLSSKSEVSQNERAYEFLQDFVSINSNRFYKNSFGEYSGEVWGKISGDYIYIIKAKFDQIMSDNGFNSTAFLSWARTAGNIKLSKEMKNTIPTKVNGSLARCVCLKITIEEEEPEQSEKVYLSGLPK